MANLLDLAGPRLDMIPCHMFHIPPLKDRFCDIRPGRDSVLHCNTQLRICQALHLENGRPNGLDVHNAYLAEMITRKASTLEARMSRGIELLPWVRRIAKGSDLGYNSRRYGNSYEL